MSPDPLSPAARHTRQEDKYPLTVLRYGIRLDTGGPGAFRGRMGAVRKYRVDTGECLLYLWWERSRTPAWRLLGDGWATGSQVIVNRGPQGSSACSRATASGSRGRTS
ncbi:MAG: hydantoinase B/oxoprolinase family protein [Bacillota bacterium]